MLRRILKRLTTLKTLKEANKKKGAIVKTIRVDSKSRQIFEMHHRAYLLFV